MTDSAVTAPPAEQTLGEVWSRVGIGPDVIVAFCRRHPIESLAFFGSILREEFHQGSDVDLLVRFVQGAGVTYLGKARMAMELEELFGRGVDLRTPSELSPFFRDRVLAESQEFYVR